MELGPWTTQDPGFYRGFAGALIFGGYLYQCGGQVDLVTAVASDCFITSAKINPDGSLQPAQVVGNPLEPKVNSQMAVVGNSVFLVGGTSPGRSDGITRFKLQGGGQVSNAFDAGRWNRNLTGSTAGIGTPVHGDIGYFYNPTTGLSAVKFTSDSINKIEDLAMPPLTNLTSTYTLLHKGHFILVAGFAVTAQTTIWKCKVNGFSVGPWVKIGELPTATRRPLACIIDNTLVVVGGVNAALTIPSAKVYLAKLDQDANLISSFAVGPDLNTACSAGGIAVSKDYVYVVGGTIDGGANRIKIVQYAKILRGV